MTLPAERAGDGAAVEAPRGRAADAAREGAAGRRGAGAIFGPLINAAGSPGDELDAPDWNEGGHVHNWRTYVPEVVRDAWPWLDRMSRLVVYIMASKRADDEDWD